MCVHRGTEKLAAWLARGKRPLVLGRPKEWILDTGQMRKKLKRPWILESVDWSVISKVKQKKFA